MLDGAAWGPMPCWHAHCRSAHGATRRGGVAAPSQSSPSMRPLQWNDGYDPRSPPGQMQQQQRRGPQRQANTPDASAAAAQQQPQAPQSQQQPQQQQRLHQQPHVRIGLKPDHFRHPLDRQNTQLLRALPGVELVAKSIMGELQARFGRARRASCDVSASPARCHSVVTHPSCMQ